ncbi:MAG: ABC transporter ATP-binding protein, partial [Planctomycetales bacterium]|nr:ABC transporter ATP-binding protein [Planctomycetales bacterium]
TLLRLAAALSLPSSGRIRTPATFHSARRSSPSPEVSCVFQRPTLLPWATAWDNVYLPLRLHGGSRRNARPIVDRALDTVGLSAFADAYPRELSGGMQMRVAVARALATAPKAILLDEPFGALDEITRRQLNDDLLKTWRESGWAALFVTHSVTEAVYLSTRIEVMATCPGRIVADIAIDLPWPRTEAMRTTPEFNAYCQQVSDALHGAMTPSAPHATSPSSI